MAATVRGYSYTGATPTAATADSADSASIKFGRDDNQNSASTASIPIPTAAGTKFSYVKWVGLHVTATAATSLLNRKVSIAASPAVPTGMSMWWGSASTYTQQNGTQGTAAANYPADSGSNGATPATITNISAWAALSTTATSYDASTVSAGSTGLNGKYVGLVCGVDNTFAGGGGAAALPNLVLTYDEQNVKTDVFSNDPLCRDGLTERRTARLPVTMRRGAMLRSR